METMEAILIGLTLIALLLGFVYAGLQIYRATRCMLAIRDEYRPGIRPWGSENRFNPFNGLVSTHLLTERGQAHAREFRVALLRFFIALITPLVLALVTWLITGTPLS